ncbi:unnamed protein product [Rotaria sp. Silwood1]|nr:unnamed protein product [Rotaria sp. Silwood1]
MNQSKTTDKNPHVRKQYTLLLDIPPRFQWDHANGFCGEMSLQCIGLYYGAWISQNLVRSLNRGEYLLQPQSAKDIRDPLRTLTLLRFTYEEWDWRNAPQPQFDQFCRWMKRSLLGKHPIIFGIFLPSMNCEDYDHIVPAVGIRYQNEDDYNCDDKVIYYDLYDDEKIERCMSADKFGATRQSISMKRHVSDGCIPLDVSIVIRITLS